MNCFTCVKWNSVYSRFFKIEYGVRQGSVLLLSLFAVYLDDIVNTLLANGTLLFYTLTIF